MKVFNLRCESGHDFEGWFGSAEDFESQLERHLIQCPMCHSVRIDKMPAAPRLNLGAHAAGVKAHASGSPQTNVDMQAIWQRALREIVAQTEDVGERFAEEARKIHYRETRERGIRGLATEAERLELAEEGIEVYPLAIPALGEGSLQ